MSMGNIFLGLFILSSFFSEGFCREFEVHYEVNDFGELAEARFQLSHGIVKRFARENTTSTASPLTKAWNRTTPKFVPTKKPSIASLPTGQTSGSGKTTTYKNTPTRQPSGFDKTTTYKNTPTHQPPGSGKPTTFKNTPTRTTMPSMTTTPRMNNTSNATGSNITIVEDNHNYFKSRYYSSGERWWFNLSDGSGTPKLHIGLTKNLMYSDTIKTTFSFPYYGHETNKVTITNKGFLFLGETLHKFNASLQYVAPLMADFGAHLHNETSIHYVDTGDRFTVEWNNLKLQNQQVGEFSFQCSVLKNGTIVFAYKKIPVAVREIKNNTFPVRVGMSDSYVMQYIKSGFWIIDGRPYFWIRYIVYYKYHEIKLRREQVKAGSAFVMTPLPNCILFKSCDTCVNSKTQFSCKWCSRLQRCSDGIDRHRHLWIVSQCHKNSETTCSGIRPRPTTAEYTTAEYTTAEITTAEITKTTSCCSRPTTSTSSATGKSGKTGSGGGSSANKRAGTAVLIVFCVLVIVAIACWFAYAYTHPLSKSGMFLMRYGNPRKWCGNSTSGSSGGGKITFKSMSHDSTA